MNHMNQLFQIIPSFNSSTDGSSPRVVCLHTCTPASMGWVGGYRWPDIMMCLVHVHTDVHTYTDMYVFVREF